MTINIRARGFNFDSQAPVQGIVYDEAREQAKAQLIHSLIHTFVALDVAIFGAWLCKWWYYGGYTWMIWALNKWVPGLIGMASHGYV